STFAAPNTFSTEASTADYATMAALDGVAWDSAGGTITNGNYSQDCFKLDVLTIARRTPGIPSNVDVTSLRSALKAMTLTWYGYGIGSNAGVATNGLTLKIWNKTTAAWDVLGLNTSSVPSLISVVITNFANYVDDNGF